MLLGHARGKVGSLVFSRSNGQQVVRARAEVIKNPQTESQMIQRILLQTAAQAYSRMQPIVDHSFEGIPAGQKSMSYFMKRTLSMLRATLAEVGTLEAAEPAVVALGTNYNAVNPYPVAKGTLPPVNPSVVAAGAAEFLVSGNTYADVINTFGLQRGDQITFVAIEGTTIANCAFKFCRIILDPREEDGTQADLDSTFIVEGIVNKPNPKNEYNGLYVSFSNNTIMVTADSLLAAACGVASRMKSDGTWLRSNASLVLADGVQIGINVQEALDAFYSGGIDIISERYLNNASRSGSVAAGGGGDQPLPPTPAPTISGATLGGAAVTGQKPVSNGIIAANALEVSTENANGKYIVLNPTTSPTVLAAGRIIVSEIAATGKAKNTSQILLQESTEYKAVVVSNTEPGSEVLASSSFSFYLDAE